MSVKRCTTEEERLFWGVFGSADLRSLIFSFHTPKWRKWKDWTDRVKAAELGHLYLFQTRFPNIGPRHPAMVHAAQHGHLQIVQWLHRNGCARDDDDCTVQPVFQAVANNHLEVLQWLFRHCHRAKVMSDPGVMDLAAARGHLEIMQWLHENGRGVCSHRATDEAARSGRLDVLQWLHANRPSAGCTYSAFDGAAANGHLEVVQWLHAHMNEDRCSDRTAIVAAEMGQLEVLQWLSENCIRLQGPHYAGGFVEAARGGHLHVVQWLYERFPNDCDLSNAHYAAVAFHMLHVVEYLDSILK